MGPVLPSTYREVIDGFGHVLCCAGAYRSRTHAVSSTHPPDTGAPKFKERHRKKLPRANHLFGEDAHLFANCTSLLPKNRMSSTPREYASGRPLPENHLASTRSRFLTLLFPCAALERFCLQVLFKTPSSLTNSSRKFVVIIPSGCRCRVSTCGHRHRTAQRHFSAECGSRALR